MFDLDLIATTTFGLESVVARELQQLGYTEQRVQNGRIDFKGDLKAICRANLWLRSADRVLIRAGEFTANDFGELFDRTESLPWSNWLSKNASFPVRGKSVRSQLHSVPDCQRLVKKAIAKNLSREYLTEWLPEDGPLSTVEVSLLKDVATLTIDTSGPGLHKRGYRQFQGQAPIKETLAAGLIQLSFWNPERPLSDPFCGSGTIPIEAALMGRNIAPGLQREFIAESWPQIPAKLWEEARTEARDSIRKDQPLWISGSDMDAECIKYARFHAGKAGVGEHIEFQQQDFSRFVNRIKYGCVIFNPPYGERLSELRAVEDLYRSLVKKFNIMDTWSWSLITAYSRLEALVKRQADRRRKLYNGRIECTYYQFHGPRPPGSRRTEVGDEHRPADDETSAS